VSRLIAGTAGGRRLVMPSGSSTRPTSDRAREGLFSSLSSLRAGRADGSFLDLYSGSGAVGLEAASRGAGPVLLVERDPRAVRAIRANLDALALGGVEVRVDDVDRLLAAPVPDGYDPGGFDVVFLDPPYAEPVEPALELLVAGGWVASGGIVVVERASRDQGPQWPPGIEPERSRRYGEATLWYGRGS
jgi:16S rRNA (guanine966-N2)-methyltransferase